MGCGFIFDIIVVRIDTPTRNFEDPNLLAVDVNFNNVALSITSSRINVAEFRSGRSYEFEANPKELRNDLENCPLKLTVKYDSETIGTGTMVWPNVVLTKITDSVGEITHVDECELMADDAKIGIVEIIVRLQCKCQEIGDDDCLKTADDIRQHLDKVINPHDILFVVGEVQKDDDCGGIFPGSQQSAEDKYTTALDLSRYRCMNGRLVQTPDVLNTCATSDCCELKKMSTQYQKLIDSLASGGMGTDRRACRASTHYRDCPHESKFSSSSTRDSSADRKFPCCCCAAQHYDDSTVFAGEKLINICPHTPPTAQQTHIVTPRYCPVCKENISWLPKLACCPKCGYKAMPVVEEKPYNDKLTADQVLQEYLEKRSSDTAKAPSATDCCKDEGPEQKESKECRCTCKNGKTCAHCRIRKLCEDIFQNNTRAPAADDEDCGKCDPKSSDMFNVCKTSSKDCRPYLARVFSELRDLYDIKKATKKPFKLDDRCEKELQGRGKHKARMPSKVFQPDVTPRHKKPRKPEPTECNPNKRKKKKVKRRPCKANDESEDDRARSDTEHKCGKKQYAYNNDRPPSNVLIGHKNCVNSFAIGKKNVPRNMGWLWNIDTQGVRRGWKPGAIRKPIKEMMKYFLRDFPADTLRVSQYAYREKGKGDCVQEEELVQKPTLHICKKNDEYFITLRPLKDPESLKHCADPYLNMKPIQFKITKNPLLTEIRKLKRCLKDMGFSKCTCHKPVVECFCRSFLDKKRLEYQLNKECRRRSIPCCNDKLVLSDTTDSDVEFDFGVTPPAGLIKPERLKKPNLVNHGTQYNENDWNIKPLFPMPPNRYMKPYNCATGAHYGYPGYGGRGGPGGWGGGWGGGGYGGAGGGFGGPGGGFGGPGGGYVGGGGPGGGRGGPGGGYVGGGGPGGGRGGIGAGGGFGGSGPGAGGGFGGSGPGGRGRGQGLVGGVGGPGPIIGRGRGVGGVGGGVGGGIGGGRGGGMGGGIGGGMGGGVGGGVGRGGGRGGGVGPGGAPIGPGGKPIKPNPGGGSVNMLTYLNKNKLPVVDAEKRRRQLSEIPPPLLCTVDRRRKPDLCGPADYCCYPWRNERIC